MAYRALTGLYTVAHHHGRPPLPWQFPWTPKTEGPGYPPTGNPEGIPPDPRSGFSRGEPTAGRRAVSGWANRRRRQRN